MPSPFFWALATVVGLLAASSLSAQTAATTGSGLPQLSPSFRQGTQVFRRLLHDARLQPIRENELGDDPHNTILIILGDAQEVLARIHRSPQLAADGPRRPSGLLRFVQEGGAVLIATDKPTTVDLGRSLRVFVNGSLVEAPPGRGYRGLAECPFLKPLPTNYLSPFEGLNRIATNNSSYLSLDVRRRSVGPAPQLHELAVLADGCRLQSKSEAARKATPTRFPFAVGGDVGYGRVLVLADHSVFINDMLLQPDLLHPDNDNLLFARNCIRGLIGAVPRSRVLIYEDGFAHRLLNVPLAAPTVPPNGKQVIDFLLHHINHDQLLDKLLFSTVPVERYKPFLFLMVTLLLLIATLVWIEKLRHRQEARVPSLAFDKPMSRESLAQKRCRALLCNGNFAEPARTLARQFFESVPLVPLLCGKQGQNDASVSPRARPKLTAEGGIWERWAYYRSIKRFWRLATSSTPTYISRRQFARLLEELRILKTAISNGRLRFG